MSESIHEIISAIKDERSVQIKFTTKQDEFLQLDGMYYRDKAPYFIISFPDSGIPDEVDLTKKCYITLKSSHPPLAIDAYVEEIRGANQLQLRAFKAIDPTSLREYFRVQIETNLSIEYSPTGNSTYGKGWTLQGKTVDLSGTGILAVFPEKLPNINNLFATLYLEYLDENLLFLVQVVKQRRLKKGAFQVAFHIENISNKDRDKIITCCLHEQRKLLRDKIQTGPLAL